MYLIGDLRDVKLARGIEPALISHPVVSAF
jgi:hypothetical protein